MDSSVYLSVGTDSPNYDTETKLGKSILLEKYLLDESSKKRMDFYTMPRELYVIPEEGTKLPPKRVYTSFDVFRNNPRFQKGCGNDLVTIPLLYVHSHDTDNPLQNICKDLDCPLNSDQSTTVSTIKEGFIENYLSIQSMMFERGSNFDEIDVHSSISNLHLRRKVPPPVPKKPLHLTAPYFRTASNENSKEPTVYIGNSKRKQEDSSRDSLTDQIDILPIDPVQKYQSQFKDRVRNEYIPPPPPNPFHSTEYLEPMEKYRVQMRILYSNQLLTNIPIAPPNPLLDMVHIESMQAYRKRMGIVDKEEADTQVVDPSKPPIAPPNPMLVPPAPPNPLFIPKPPVNPLLLPKKWYRDPIC
ncbi:hypothetical protein HDV04_004221 [Boothiomyces sp. JEL0838]|nr:hypothetical protein HDV04_004221 [Boothiomyces sp. JEL0838]